MTDVLWIFPLSLLGEGRSARTCPIVPEWDQELVLEGKQEQEHKPERWQTKELYCYRRNYILHHKNLRGPPRR